MSVYLEDTDCTIWYGDALSVLRELPDESIHCTVTSPPFYGLRDYGVDGQIGLEASPEEWCSRLVDVFREVRRVLRADGVCWIECGDSYANTEARKPFGDQGRRDGALSVDHGVKRTIPKGCKPKDLLGQAWLLAFALRADGWWLRSCVIWSKPNCMPESATDRPTTAHTYVYLLSKSVRSGLFSQLASTLAAPTGSLLGGLEKRRPAESWYRKGGPSKVRAPSSTEARLPVE